MSQGDCRHASNEAAALFGGTHRHRDAAPAHERPTTPAVRAAFRFALSFENNDLTHARFRLKQLAVRRGCACMSSTLTVRRIVADGAACIANSAPHRCASYAPGEAPEAELLNVETDAASAIAAQRAVSDESTTFLLTTEGHPAGMIGAYFDNTPDRRAFVSELWVAHAVRHLRGGVLLLETATAWLAERGAGTSTRGLPMRTATRSASTSGRVSAIPANTRRSHGCPAR